MAEERELEREIVRALAQGEEPREVGTYWVSDLVRCSAYAAQLYIYRCVPRPSPLSIAGRLWHYGLPKALEGLIGGNWEVKCEMRLDDCSIVGRADCVSEDRVYEFKFTASELFSDRGPLAMSIAQANAYAHMLDRPRFTVVLINRSSFAVKAYTYDRDVDSFKHLVARALRLHDVVTREIIPTEESPLYGWECGTRNYKCQFHAGCPRRAGR